MTKAILFDLVRTLLDRDASLIKFIKDQYKRFPEALGHIEPDTYVQRFVELDAKGYVWKDQVYRDLISEFNITGVDKDQMFQDYLDNFKHHCIGFNNLHMTLKSLKNSGMKLGIILNGRCQFQMDNIRGLEIEEFFDTILISACEDLKKPDPEIFERALLRLDVRAEEAVFVGDHPVNDIKAAKQVGMRSVWKKGQYWKEAEADVVINDLKELEKIVG